MWAEMSAEQKKTYGEDYYEAAMTSVDKYSREVSCHIYQGSRSLTFLSRFLFILITLYPFLILQTRSRWDFISSSPFLSLYLFICLYYSLILISITDANHTLSLCFFLWQLHFIPSSFSRRALDETLSLSHLFLSLYLFICLYYSLIFISTTDANHSLSLCFFIWQLHFIPSSFSRRALDETSSLSHLFYHFISSSAFITLLYSYPSLMPITRSLYVSFYDN